MASLGHNKAYIPLHHNLWRNLYTIITSRDSSVKWFYKNIKRVGFTFMDIHYNPDGCSSFHWLPACNMKLGYKNQSCHGVNAVTVNAFFDSNATHADILSQTFLMVSIRIMVYQNTDLILCQIWQGHEYGNEKCENVILHLMVLKHNISFKWTFLSKLPRDSMYYFRFFVLFKNWCRKWHYFGAHLRCIQPTLWRLLQVSWCL